MYSCQCDTGVYWPRQVIDRLDTASEKGFSEASNVGLETFGILATGATAVFATAASIRKLPLPLRTICGVAATFMAAETTQTLWEICRRYRQARR